MYGAWFLCIVLLVELIEHPDRAMSIHDPDVGYGITYCLALLTCTF